MDGESDRSVCQCVCQSYCGHCVVSGEWTVSRTGPSGSDLSSDHASSCDMPLTLTSLTDSRKSPGRRLHDDVSPATVSKAPTASPTVRYLNSTLNANSLKTNIERLQKYILGCHLSVNEPNLLIHLTKVAARTIFL